MNHTTRNASPSPPVPGGAMRDDDLQSLHPAIRGLRTVCRCNNVKYRTIEKAIREGCHTIAQVAARTTATTGHCGGSCTPIVHDMIDAITAENDGGEGK